MDRFGKCAEDDDIKKTVDYSELVKIVKDHSKKIYCLTIEKYSNEIIEISNEKFELKQLKLF